MMHACSENIDYLLVEIFYGGELRIVSLIKYELQIGLMVCENDVRMAVT